MEFKRWLNESEKIIYQDDTGYIAGYQQSDGYWWIEEIVIYPQFRGQGLARELSSHLPRKSKFLTYPLMNMAGPHLSQEDLIEFYTSLGFDKAKDEHGNVIMQRS